MTKRKAENSQSFFFFISNIKIRKLWDRLYIVDIDLIKST